MNASVKTLESGTILNLSDVLSVVVRTNWGKEQFLPGHTGLLTILKPCVVYIETGDGTQALLLENGLLEIDSQSNVKIMTEKCHRKDTFKKTVEDLAEEIKNIDCSAGPSSEYETLASELEFAEFVNKSQ
ncbi:hypothetical protein KKF34_04300 [Myxococcota bacterium]|nr:hypothetical protein [Myxococcota bacterium]MBU1382564.1 hypothetical protein [Myxococcota bacterium]MBU1496079.1 hypothetical protein [Myxococcota bacterium]